MLLRERIGAVSAFTACADAADVAVVMAFPRATGTRLIAADTNRVRGPGTTEAPHPLDVLATPNRSYNGANVVSRRLVASLGSLRPTSVGGDVVSRRALDQRFDLVLHRLDPTGSFRPLCSIPLGEIDAVVTVVIAAAQIDRGGKAVHTELFPARVGDVERLQSPAHVFAC